MTRIGPSTHRRHRTLNFFLRMAKTLSAPARRSEKRKAALEKVVKGRRK